MEKRLIPYSVHLPEDVFHLIKQAAGERKAAGLIREAIVSFVQKRSAYDRGFESGLEAAMKRISANKIAAELSWKGDSIADILNREINALNK